MADSDRIPHAMLFYEKDGGGAFPIIMHFLKYLYCEGSRENRPCNSCSVCSRVSKMIHPDIHFVFPVTSGSKVSGTSSNLTSELFLDYWRELVLRNPYFLKSDLDIALGIEGKSGIINVTEAKAIINKLSLASVEGGYRTVVIYLPECMNVNAANKLLKIIEEPPKKTIFLMITHAPGKVLQTITSRCQAFRIDPPSTQEIKNILIEDFCKNVHDAEEASAVACGSIGAALDYLSENSHYQENLDLFSDLMTALTSKNLYESLSVGEVLAGLKSRERQKEFCKFAGAALRKIFFYQKNMSDLAILTEEEAAVFPNYAGRCGKQFCRKALSVFNNAFYLLDRNVNQKIVFCDLVNHLYILIR